MELTVTQNVKAKGERLVQDKAVILLREDNESAVFLVRGDTDDHTVFIHKANILADSCSCTWNNFHNNEPSCSHRYAARLQLMLVAAA